MTAVDSVLGFPVYESAAVRPGRVVLAAGALYVRDAWRDLRLALLLAELRMGGADDIRQAADAVRDRLGLVPDAL